MFIEKADLKITIRPEFIEQISRQDDTIIAGCIDSTIAEMRSYLATRYNVDTIFSQTGDQRNKLLVALACDITVYNLVAVIPPGIDIEDRRARYKRAIQWLKDAGAGIVKTNLPPLVDAELNPINNIVEYGSAPKRENNL